MQSKFLNKLNSQKKIPIIGKGSNQEISNKFDRLIKEKFEIIEITLRTDEALGMALKIKEQNPKAIIGLGSIKSLNMLKEVSNLNFDFYISPGINKELLDFSNSKNLNFIPGVSTPSEIMTAIQCGNNILKFFHAEKNGGVKSLEFLHDIFDDIKFIPTGGINKENFKFYLDLANVIAVGSTGF